MSAYDKRMGKPKNRAVLEEVVSAITKIVMHNTIESDVSDMTSHQISRFRTETEVSHFSRT